MKKKKKYIFSGEISIKRFGDWETIFLIQPNGEFWNLVARIDEIPDYSYKTINVSYLISDERVPIEKLEETILKKICGYLGSDFSASSYEYSEWTSGTDYDVNLTIGGHNLFEELKGSVGKHLILRIEI